MSAEIVDLARVRFLQAAFYRCERLIELSAQARADRDGAAAQTVLDELLRLQAEVAGHADAR
jgi:hypothetical protein